MRNYASIYTSQARGRFLGWGGFYLGPSHRVAAAFSARGCPHGKKLCTAHYFSTGIRNLLLSKNFLPFGWPGRPGRVALKLESFAAGRRKIRRRKRLKPSRKEEMHTKKQLLILIKSMMTESDTWTLVSETSSRVGELT